MLESPIGLVISRTYLTPQVLVSGLGKAFIPRYRGTTVEFLCSRSGCYSDLSWTAKTMMHFLSVKDAVEIDFGAECGRSDVSLSERVKCHLLTRRGKERPGPQGMRAVQGKHSTANL